MIDASMLVYDGRGAPASGERQPTRGAPEVGLRKVRFWESGGRGRSEDDLTHPRQKTAAGLSVSVYIYFIRS